MKNLQQTCYLLKGIFICDVVHKDGPIAVPVIDGTQGMEPFLTCCVLSAQQHTVNNNSPPTKHRKSISEAILELKNRLCLWVFVNAMI